MELLDQFADSSITCRRMACDLTVRVYIDRRRRPSRFYLLRKLAFFLKKHAKFLAKLFDIRGYASTTHENDLELISMIFSPFLYLRKKRIARSAVRADKQEKDRLASLPIVGEPNALSIGVRQLKFGKRSAEWKALCRATYVFTFYMRAVARDEFQHFDATCDLQLLLKDLLQIEDSDGEEDQNSKNKGSLQHIG